MNACKGEGKVKQVSAKMAVTMTADQFRILTLIKPDQVWPGRSGKAKIEVTMTADQLQMLIATLRGVGGGGAAGTAGAVGPMVPYSLGMDKFRRPKR